MKEYAPMLKMYTEYVKNFDNAMNLITVWSDKAPRFAAIMKEIQVNICLKIELKYLLMLRNYISS